ncbi:hypothetical protein BCJMU10_0544 [Bacillus cereus]|nr:hypothetical protein BCJMU10_0544 [Bacillus cereus]
MLLVTLEKQYNEAMEIYNHIIREATSFADKDNILSIALNNIGYLYYRQKIIPRQKSII